jgi:NAD(P)-dependent dehydrogenase (short-subunit alcohol dehydrogenase family)
MLTGKAVVVTGAGGGLGRAYAVDAARHGASVVVNDIDMGLAEETVAAIRSFGGTAIPHGGSVAEWTGAEAIIATCVDTFGKIDGLVNNAGIGYPTPAGEETEQRLHEVVGVNVLGPLHCGRHAIRHMRERRSGSIVNIISRAYMGVAEDATYSATKGATTSLTYAWALGLAPFGIRANCVAPHATTPGHLAHAADVRQRNATPSWQSGRPPAPAPEKGAPIVTFLLSDQSSYVNGQAIFMNGHDLSIMRHPKMSDTSLRQEDWSAEQIAAAFDRQLRADLDSNGIPFAK